MGKALYRKYRSRKLSEIVGQEHVTTLLTNALKTDRIAHAYLFTGPRGVGKTSIARILAHEINQLPYEEERAHLDIIEIDAASNNGVDDIRDLREKVALAPTSANKKIYIIDEVHMLSKSAFNALLKTLEEPPEHVVFILATTDINKLPATIVSRTQRYTFRRASQENLIENLRRIALAEKITIDDEALMLIAEHADGSYRDSVSIFDQMSSLAPKNTAITRELIEQSLGLAPRTVVEQLLSQLAARDFDASMQTIRDLEQRGIQASVIATQIVRAIQFIASGQPQLLQLIDGLIDVTSSPIPHAKLAAVIGLFCTPTPPQKSVATVATPIPSLAKKATEEHPIDELPQKKSTAPAAKPAKKPKTPSAQPQKPITLDWTDFTTRAKRHSIALSTLLGACSHDIANTTLTIFARNEFYKKKLDTAKYRQILQDLLRETADYDWEIEVIPGNKPPANSKVAAVAAMMGGGEEVELQS